MGFLEFGLLVVLVVCIAAFITWLITYLAGPDTPAIVCKIIWVIAVCIILFLLAGAVGLHDVPMPRLR
jgi:hypothetical protein